MKLNLQKKKFITEKNLSDIVKIGINFGEKLNAISQKCINPYDDSGATSYIAGEYVIHDGYIWQVKVATSGAWVESRFTKLCDELSLIDLQTIKNMINLSDEEIANLQSLILDSSIELSHVWSSSKTYTEIQNAIKKGEAFTLSKLATTMTASFEIATSTTSMTEGNILYLLSTGTNTYDIYALIGGTPTKIASTTIDLSQYAKLTDLNDYLKKTDADGKYATITTVDSKVDKTSILSTISSTPSDDKLLSEKAIDDTFVKKTDIVDNLTSTDTDKPLSANQGKVLKDEIDSKANDNEVVKKTDITTKIDSTSTDTQVPSAKSIKTELDLKEDVSNKTTTINSSSTNTQYPSAKAVYNLVGNENRRGYVFNNPTYRGNTWNRVFKINSLLSCNSGFLTVVVYSNGLCQIATFLMSKNFNRLNVKQINCGGYNGNDGQARPIKVRIIGSETNPTSFLEIYVSGTTNTNVMATYMPLCCDSVVVSNEAGSIPNGMFACEMTATHDTYSSATYTGILK